MQLNNFKSVTNVLSLLATQLGLGGLTLAVKAVKKIDANMDVW